MKVARIEIDNGISLSVSDGQLPLTIGRDRECDIRISEASISRQHCELYLGTGQMLRLKDFSANGTQIDRRTLHRDSIGITKRTEVFLSDHHAITVTPTDDNGITLVP
jgi:pSer/pThr/pTyr-binding forkhead associated (FHA) protein